MNALRRVTLVLLVSMSVVSGPGVSAADEPADEAQTTAQQTDKERRHVRLTGEPNFRDIGGYRTTDGRQVAMGLVFRSGRLPGLTDEDVAVLERICINTVVNFLTDDEIKAAGADRVPDGCRKVFLPIESDDGIVGVILEARRTADFSKLHADLNPGFHQMLAEQAMPQYADLLREIIRTDEPLVFHCSHGIHRTGTATAILLWAVGVPWETIREDYLLSNHYRQHEVKRRLDQFRKLIAQKQQIDPDDVDMTNLNAFYILQPHYIDSARDWILQEYGGIDQYLTKGLGLTPQEIRQLRSRLLQD